VLRPGDWTPCRDFFIGMPTDAGLAFVVVQHLDPDHKSQLATLLGRSTRMAVVEALDRVWVELNHVYVIVDGRGY
jgi:two-component system, chemotaxis family, CheB/CheR fusion protein